MTRLAGSPLLRSVPPRVRDFLDSWRFWITLGFAGIIGAIILGYYNLHRTMHDENSRIDAAYVSCLEAIPLLRRFSTHVTGVNEVIGKIGGRYGIYVQNTEALVEATPRSDPAYKTRAANLRRARQGANDVAAAQAIPVPTKAQCLKAARAAVQRISVAAVEKGK